MKKIAFIILCGLAYWQYFYQPEPQDNIDYKPKIAAFFDMVSASKQSQSSQQGFACDNRQMCNEMSTQAEAAYFYQHCPNQNLQLDPDGTPCGTFFE